MSYVDKNLMDGEQVFYRTRRHWTIFGGAIFFLCAGLVVFIAVRIWGQQEWAGNVSIVALALGALIALLKAIPAWIDRATSEFAVTNKRVLIKTGLIRRHTLELLLEKVETVGVDQGIFGRILNYGAIIVIGTGGTKELFPGIAKPLEFRKAVQYRATD